MSQYIVGIDEAGRGPLAGPVSVGAVLVPHNFDWNLVPGVRDSKKLSEKKREEIFEHVQGLRETSELRYTVATSSASYIDTYGIVPAIKRALAEALSKLEVAPAECRVLLDGSLKAPAEYIEQETIIRGDDSEPVISLASIMAKVTRDRMMKQLSAKYPEYEFHVHKGYGTAGHRQAIAQYGFSKLHRATFCTRILRAPEAEIAGSLHEDRVVL